VQRKVIVGRVSGLFGVHGWVKVFSYTEPREMIASYRNWFIGSEKSWQPYEIAEGKKHGKGVVVRVSGIADRDQAAELVGSDIAVDRDTFPASGKDKYYWTDLIGLNVATVDGQDLGKVAGLMETGANDVLVVEEVVEGADGCERQRLIPFVTGEVVTDVDLDGGRIVVDWDPDF
jgi:16S rRNA processing protein RimM